EGGVGRIVASVPKVEIVPIALRYEFWEEQRAEALLYIGKPLALDRRESHRRITAEIERAVLAGLETLAAAHAARQCGQILLHGKPSISRWREGKSAWQPAPKPSGEPAAPSTLAAANSRGAQ
ncbi:MAG: hypothetical protein NZ561_02885, partial [Phycisphaerae bacterium]|nr:hypothetical protein [Phycisphaerae bacterium]